jgi:hypothetical protein
MLLVVPFIALMAMEQAILWTDFTKVSFKLSQSQENCMLISYGRISKPLSTNNNNIHELDRTVFEIYREI